MTNSVMSSDLALNELQSNERRFGDDFDNDLNRNDLNSNLDTNDNHLTTSCGQQLSPIGSANSSLSSQHLSLSSPKNESKHQQNANSFNDYNDCKTFNDLEKDSNHVKNNKTSLLLSAAEDKHKQCSDQLSDNEINDNNQTNSNLYNLSNNSNKSAKRVVLDEQTLMSLTVQEFRHHWNEQQLYINYIETQLKQLNRDKSDLISLRESEEKLKQQQLEANRRENVLVMRLTTKEQEMQEYLNQIRELKQSQVPTTPQLQTTLIDPAINLVFEKMKKEVDSSRAKVEEMQSELNAWKFTPDSTTGKRLMSKCRLLYQENEELGKMIESGRIAKLEGELALQKNFSEELKKSQSELDDILLDFDEDMEGMQNTIIFLQKELKEAKEKITKYESNHQNDKQCVQNSNSIQTKTTNNSKVFERTLESSDNREDGVHRRLTIEGNPTDNDLNESNRTVVTTADDEFVDCVNTNQRLDSVEKTSKTSNTVSNSEPTVRTVDTNEDNSLNNNYLSSVVNKTTNKLNNELIINTKRTSCFQTHIESDGEDDDEPSLKVAKLNDNNCSVKTIDEDICGKQTNSSMDCGLSSCDSLNTLNTNTLKTNCIEINGQTNP